MNIKYTDKQGYNHTEVMSDEEYERRVKLPDSDTDSLAFIENHSRFDEEHYRHCQDCYENHLDFMQEMEMEARMDEADNNDEEYEDD